MPSSTAPTRSKLRSTLCKGVAAIVVAAAAGASLFTNDSVSASITEKRIERLNATIENIYTTDYQQMADDNLAKKRDAKEHTLDSIFIAANPYGTNTMSLYVYFTTDQTTSISYTVHADGYPDFAQTVAQDEQYQTEHEFTVLGLIPGVKNTITFTSTDANGSMAAKLVDFGEMFPDYKASTDHSGIDESDPTASGRWDWIHFNTIQLLPDGQYYIYMFDNNFGYAMTRPDYDWTTIADISTAKSSNDKDSRSQYRRYQYDFKGFYFV